MDASQVPGAGFSGAGHTQHDSRRAALTQFARSGSRHRDEVVVGEVVLNLKYEAASRRMNHTEARGEPVIKPHVRPVWDSAEADDQITIVGIHT